MRFKNCWPGWQNTDGQNGRARRGRITGSPSRSPAAAYLTGTNHAINSGSLPVV